MAKCWFFFSRKVECSAAELLPKKRQPEEVVQVLQTVLWSLERALPWNRDAIEAAIKEVSAFWDWPIRDITAPLFATIMAQKVGPPLFESIDLLGELPIRDRGKDFLMIHIAQHHYEPPSDWNGTVVLTSK